MKSRKGLPRRTHGQSRTKLYQVWAMMKSRCHNPRHPQFLYWGGRGIRVCQKWMEFPAFESWARQHGYGPGLYLDRLRNSEGYCPENCAWVTPQKSGANRRTTKLTFGNVEEIKRRCSEGELQKNVAVHFGVARNTVSNIVTGKRWVAGSRLKLDNFPEV